MMATRAVSAHGMPRTSTKAPWIGLVVAVAILGASFTLPRLLDWQVTSLAVPDTNGTAMPLHSYWDPTWFGPGTVPAVVIAVLALWLAAPLAARLPFKRMLLMAYLASVAWMLALAFIDGSEGIARVLDSRFEYFEAAGRIDDVPQMLHVFIGRIPTARPDAWPVHVAGHPPGAFLFFIVLIRAGVTSPLWAGLVTSVIGATSIVAVLLTLRLLGAEGPARRVAPFLAFSPALIFVCVSADGMFAAFAAWGLAALAAAATARGRMRRVLFSVVAGLILGWCVMLSYGLPLLGLLALAILIAARGSWWPLLIAAVSAFAVVLAFVPFGYAWWDAYPVLVDRYWAGAAAIRPFSYWAWGNLGALLVSTGPMLGAGIGLFASGLFRCRRERKREDLTPDRRVLLLLVGAAVLIIVAADLSRMSKAEVERIWLPFIPWLTVSLALLPRRWVGPALAVQLVAALAVQTLLYTTW